MTPKKIPLRRCNGCGESKPKKELVRVVPETQFALAQISKKPTGVFAVTDPELAKLCRKNLAAQAANQKEERPCQ